MVSNIFIPEFIEFAVPGERFVVGKKPVLADYDRLGAEKLLERLRFYDGHNYFHLSDARTEFLIAAKTGRKNRYSLFLRPILVSKGTPRKGCQKDLGDYVILGASPYLNSLGEFEENAVLSEPMVRKQDGRTIIASAKYRALKSKDRVIRFDPENSEQLCPADGIPVGDSVKGNYRLVREEGIRPVVLTKEYNLDATGEFSPPGVLKPRIRLVKKDENIPIEEIIGNLVKAGTLETFASITYKPSGDSEIDDRHIELLEWLMRSGRVQCIDYDFRENVLVLGKEIDSDFDALINLMVEKQTLEKGPVYRFVA